MFSGLLSTKVVLYPKFLIVIQYVNFELSQVSRGYDKFLNEDYN